MISNTIHKSPHPLSEHWKEKDQNSNIIDGVQQIAQDWKGEEVQKFQTHYSLLNEDENLFQQEPNESLESHLINDAERQQQYCECYVDYRNELMYNLLFSLCAVILLFYFTFMIMSLLGDFS